MTCALKFLWRGLIALCVISCGLFGSTAVVQAASPPVIVEVSVSNVAGTSATLQAQINPEGSGTTYRFEYDTSEYDSNASHGVSVPSAEGSVGEGSAPVTVEAHLQGLSMAAEYHFRVVATNTAHETVYAEDQTFTTSTVGTSFTLLDGRHWELVSPPNKSGALIEPIEEGVMQAAEDGGAVTYIAARVAVGSEPLGNTQRTQVLSNRGPGGGWSSRDINTPHEKATGTVGGIGWEYRFFSSDLSLAAVEPQGETPLPPLPEGAERTIYRRSNTECEPTATEAIPATCYQALVTKENVQPGVHFGIGQGAQHGGVDFVDATPDLSHVILKSSYALTENAPENGQRENLYEWSDGRLSLVSVLPDRSPSSETSALGLANADVRNAVSDDGSRIVWGTVGENKHIYMRDMETEQTVQLDTGLSGNPEFQLASADGSKVFFTDNGDLYDFEVAAGSNPLAGTLKNLTNGASVLGDVLGASEDGSYLYFVSGGALPGSGATSGGNNLYVDHYEGGEWKPTLIAALSEEDASDWKYFDRPGDLGFLTARVSPNGTHVVFISHASLTGYDNHDAVSGQPDTEVYSFDAERPVSIGERDVSDNPVCVSCDPTGARPVGMEDSGNPLVDQRGILGGQWLAGSVPGWTPAISGVVGEALYQSRYLSDGGRVFFNSTDALVPQDTNGVADVYEYEPVGEGGCVSTTIGFHERLGGCVGLVSSGTSGEESAFVDASAGGGDVFFLTSSRLVGQDVDTARDVYDAHECSVGLPCLVEPATPPACTTSDSCKAAPTPQPGIFGNPSSATFTGAGNVVPAAAPSVKQRSLTRAQRLADALKACKKRPKKKRAGCRASAHRKFGVKRAKVVKAKLKARGSSAASDRAAEGMGA